MACRFRLREQGYDNEKAIERVSKLFSLSKQDIINPSRQNHGFSNLQGLRGNVIDYLDLLFHSPCDRF